MSLIGIDIDGVLADQVSPVLHLLEEEHGIQMEYNDVEQYREPIPGLEINIYNAITSAQEDEDHVLNLPVLEGAIEGVSKLQKLGDEIWMITSRSTRIRPATEQWLADNELGYDKLVFVEKPKSMTETDLLIDDHHKELLQFLETGRPGIMYRHPWNAGRLNPDTPDEARFRIVDGWDELPDAAEELLSHY